MTDKEKLEKCVSFIKKLSEHPGIRQCTYDSDDDIDDIRWELDAAIDDVNDLIDSAWHILVDITD